MRIALVGASSTGKSTVFEALKRDLNSANTLQFVDESTRTVARYGFPINESGTNLTQLAISSFHLEHLLNDNKNVTIYDRCYLDLVAYTRHLPGVSKEVRNYIEDTWNRVSKAYTYYFYFPIEFQSVEDGVRSVNENWRSTIDQEFRILLKDVANVTVMPRDLNNRIEIIKTLLM